MGIEQRNVQENGGFSRTELMKARDEDATRLRAQWVRESSSEQIIRAERDEVERIAREGRL
jgi:hypothetical protein